MQKFFVPAVLLFSLSILTPSFAANTSTVSKDFKVDGQTLHTLVPRGWEAIPNFIGIPIALVSQPGKQAQRAVIQITPYGIKDDKDILGKMEKDPESFYEQKEDWLAHLDGDSISYQPYEEIKKDGSSIYTTGIKYRVPAGDFLDTTYYVSSKSKQLYFIKTLIPLDMLDEQGPLVSEVVDTFTAKN